jgi:hypothetical protein
MKRVTFNLTSLDINLEQLIEHNIGYVLLTSDSKYVAMNAERRKNEERSYRRYALVKKMTNDSNLS